MTKSDEDTWQSATFEGTRRAQVRETAATSTPYERIRWACEMSEAIRLRTRDLPPQDPNPRNRC